MESMDQGKSRENVMEIESTGMELTDKDKFHWDRERVGKVLRKARLKQGLSLYEIYRRTGIKSQTTSAIERGLRRRPPERNTQAKLEQVLGVNLPIPRDPPKFICIYVSFDELHYIEEAVDAFPGKSQSQAIMNTLKAWSERKVMIAKLEEDYTNIDIRTRVFPDDIHYVEEAMNAYPGESQSKAIMNALKAWSEHQAALAKWNKEHNEYNLGLSSEIRRIAQKNDDIQRRKRREK